MVHVVEPPSDIHSRSRRAGYDPELLFGANALVVGAGAIGQNLVQDLALAGVGHLCIVDFDAFEPHNATRSPFFPAVEEQERFGVDKATIVATKARALMTADSPSMRYASSPIEALGDAPFAWADIVFSAVDRPAARAYLANRSRLHRTPMIEAGFNGSEVNLSVFGPGADDPCWQCTNRALDGAFSCATYALEMEKEGIIPGIQNSAALLAALQAESGIMWLHGARYLEGRVTYGDIRAATLKPVRLTRDPDCQITHRNAGRLVTSGVTADDPLRDLLQDIARQVGAGLIRLPSQFVYRAFCVTCGQLTEPTCPEWHWMSAPTCVSCGGHAPVCQHAQSPVGFLDVATGDTGTLGEILDLPCRQFGLVPGTYVETWMNEEAQPHLFALRGTIDDLVHQLSAA